MEGAGYGSGFGSSPLDFCSQGIDGTSDLLGGLSIHAGENVAPLSSLYTASQSQFPQILDSMRELAALHNDPHKHWFQIPYKTLLITALKSVGIADPIFTVKRYQGCFQVSIEFTSILPLCIASASSHAKIIGDVNQTLEVAERTAVDKGFLYLREVHNLRLVDISARKQTSLICTSHQYYHSSISRLELLNSYLGKWHKCVENLFQVQAFASPKLKHGNPTESGFAQTVYNAMDHIQRIALYHIGRLYRNMNALSTEKNKFVEGSRSRESFNPRLQVGMKKAYFHDVETLDLLLQYLNVPVYHYSVRIDDDGLYIGGVWLPCPDEKKKVPAHGTFIEANRSKRAIAKAHNAAAREAIYHLEKHFCVQVSGYNHDDVVEAEQEMFVWKGLNNETRSLAETVLKFWEDMLQRLQESIDLHKKTCLRLANRPFAGDEMVFIHDLVGRLDITAASCTKLYKVAVARLSALE